MVIMKKNLWYKNGLKFKCTKCGKCCTGAPGFVWLSTNDVEKIASFLKISIPAFKKNYTRQVKNKTSLIEDSITFDCIFLKNKKCTIYEARPLQCKAFPFWKDNLLSEEKWNSISKICEGINHDDATPISPEEIHIKINKKNR